MLDRNFFEQKEELQVKKIWLDTVQDEVFVREMTAEELDSYELSIVTVDAQGNIKQNLNNHKEKFLVRVLCDETGKRLFRDEEYKILGKKKPALINELYRKASAELFENEEDVKKK